MSSEVHHVRNQAEAWVIHGTGPSLPIPGSAYYHHGLLVATIGVTRTGVLTVNPGSVVACPVQHGHETSGDNSFAFQLDGGDGRVVLTCQPRSGTSPRVGPGLHDNPETDIDPSSIGRALSDTVRRQAVRSRRHPATSSGSERRRIIGTATHAAVTELVERVHPALPSIEQISEVVRPLLADASGPAAHGARSDVVTGVAGYVRHGWPPSHWTLIETEASAPSPSGRCDLLWRTGDGRVVGDEVKSGMTVDDAAVNQVGLQQARLRSREGNDAAGVRLFLTGNPTSSLYFPADGSGWRPLSTTAFWFQNDLRRDGKADRVQ